MSRRTSLQASDSSSKRKRRLAVDTQDETKPDEGISFPIREIDQLYASHATVHCALHRLCVPCAYKVCCFDVARDSEFSVPNQRPENCPRLQVKPESSSKEILGYSNKMSVLTVGDGDFSFSLAVAHLLSSSNKKGKANRLVVTSYEKEETLRRVYPEFDKTLSELKSLGAIVCFEVDATRLKETLPPSALGGFHRIIWNFPCTAIDKGQDGQNDAMEDNKELVRNFVSNSREFLYKGGEIHMCHKTKPPFNQWKLQELVIAACRDGKGPQARYEGRIVLDRALLPPYAPRKALNRKSFPCHDACHYIFGFDRALSFGDDDQPCPPTIPKKPKEFPDDAGDHDVSVVPVTQKLVALIREAHLSNTVVKNKLRKGKKKHKR